MTEVVAALIWDGDLFLACQRPANKARGLLWEFVGGKVEPGETREQALIRECREELAITVRVDDIFMEVTHEYPDLTVHRMLKMLLDGRDTSNASNQMAAVANQSTAREN